MEPLMPMLGIVMISFVCVLQIVVVGFMRMERAVCAIAVAVPWIYRSG